jgi:predicted nucleotidyltransferase
MAELTLTMGRLRQLAPELQALTRAHGGSNLRVFGSVLRGTAGPGSDLDVLVEFSGSPTFEQFMDLKLALEDRLQVRVDLVTRAGLRAELRERIEREAQLLICYGKTSMMTPCIPTKALHEQWFGGDRPLPQGVR